jgi:nitrogen fixation NifU-like protein
VSPENGWSESAAAAHGGQVPITDILYREVILDHYRAPRGRGEVSPPDAMAAGRNPLCGDEIRVTLKEEGGSLAQVRHEGHGCAISVASASMMAELLEGAGVERARETAGAFKAMLLEGGEATDEMGDLEVLEGVKSYPVRIKCALLPWNALLDALDVLAGGSDE